MAGDKRQPIRYEHDSCNVTSGAVHLFVSARRRILNAGWMVECVRDEGLPRLEAAIAADDIHDVILTYTDCYGKLENALLVFGASKTIYEEYLEEPTRARERLAQDLMFEINRQIEVYRHHG